MGGGSSPHYWGDGGAKDRAASQPWAVLETRYLQRSPWRDVRVDRVRLHTGEEIEYTYLEGATAAFVVPLTRGGRIILVRQYRHTVRDWLLEVPAGTGAGEPIEVTARRELAEEIGGTCGELIDLGAFYPAAAHLAMPSRAFLALDVELGATSHEATELLEVIELDPEEAFARAHDGRIADGQSALALLRAEPLVRARLAAPHPPAPSPPRGEGEQTPLAPPWERGRG